MSEETKTRAQGHDDDGRFMVGHERQGGRQRGSLNRITAQMKTRLAERIEDGEDADPLFVMSSIMTDLKQSAMVRLRAAESLAKVLLPRLLQIDLDTGQDSEIEIRAEKITSALRAYFVPKRNAGDQDASIR